MWPTIACMGIAKDVGGLRFLRYYQKASSRLRPVGFITAGDQEWGQHRGLTKSQHFRNTHCFSHQINKNNDLDPLSTTKLDWLVFPLKKIYVDIVKVEFQSQWRAGDASHWVKIGSFFPYTLFSRYF